MNKKYLLIIITLIVSIAANAQYGYMGKRFAVKLDGYFIPAIRSEPKESNDYSSGPNLHFKGLATTGNISFVRITKYNSSLSLEYNHFIDYELSRNDLDLLNVTYIRQRSLGVGYKMYIGNWMAPIGYYYKFSAFANKNEWSDYEDFASSKSAFSVKFGFAIGFQRVLFDRILFDVGAGGYLDSYGIMNRFAEGTLGDWDSKIGERILKREFFRLKIGVGYLF